MACWAFLSCDDGLAAYHRERKRFEAIYDRLGRFPMGDGEVRGVLVAEGPVPPDWAIQLPPPPRPAAQGKPDWTPAAPPPGADLELPTHEVRFAHDDQSELFTHHGDYAAGGGGVSLLQLAVELVTGLTAPEAVPAFSVCRHQGRWYCRSGNRRLAALRLAQRVAPVRFGKVRVKAVPVDKLFVQGAPGKRPKLTTHRNGEACEGQWLVIRETGEVVGHGGRAGGGKAAAEYGADLLALLPFIGSLGRERPAVSEKDCGVTVTMARQVMPPAPPPAHWRAPH